MIENKTYKLKIRRFVFIIAILSVIHIFIKDISIFFNWNNDIINIVRLSGFMIDMIFLTEFLFCLFYSAGKKRLLFYIFNNEGWLDFIVSIPVLIIFSGPEFINLMFKFDIFYYLINEIFNIDYLSFKNFILILNPIIYFRLLKIWNNADFIKSHSAKRHTGLIFKIIIGVFSVFLIIISFFGFNQVLFLSSDNAYYNEKKINEFIIHSYNYKNENEFIKMTGFMLDKRSNVVKISIDFKSYFESKYYDVDFLRYNIQNKTGNVYVYNINLSSNKLLTVYYSRIEYNEFEALNNILKFSFIIALLVCIFIFYHSYFLLSVIKPINIMILGFEKKNYINQAYIDKNNNNDEISRLSLFYNERWLNAKKRKLNDDLK